MSANHRTERMCPDCGQLILMVPRQERCASCQKKRKNALALERHRKAHPPEAPHEIVCAECGKIFHGLHIHKYCPACSTPEAQKARANKRARIKKPRELKCAGCGAVFVDLPGRRYCPACSTPEAVAERRKKRNEWARGSGVPEIAYARVHGESDRARKERLKREKLIADLISGAREPRDNHEAIIRIEALGRIHGGMSGSYGKEVAGYYEQKE